MPLLHALVIDKIVYKNHDSNLKFQSDFSKTLEVQKLFEYSRCNLYGELGHFRKYSRLKVSSTVVCNITSSIGYINIVAQMMKHCGTY